MGLGSLFIRRMVLGFEKVRLKKFGLHFFSLKLEYTPHPHPLGKEKLVKSGETNRAVSYVRLSNCDSNFIISLVFFYSFMISIKSCGPDNVTSCLLRKCANPITSPLSTLSVTLSVTLSDAAVVVFQKCGRWLIRLNFIGLATRK